MGLNMEKVTSFIAYWLSVALAAFGAMTPQDFAAWFGVFGVVMTVSINWYYRRKSYLLELSSTRVRPIVMTPPPKRR